MMVLGWLIESIVCALVSGSVLGVMISQVYQFRGRQLKPIKYWFHRCCLVASFLLFTLCSWDPQGANRLNSIAVVRLAGSVAGCAEFCCFSIWVWFTCRMLYQQARQEPPIAVYYLLVMSSGLVICGNVSGDILSIALDSTAYSSIFANISVLASALCTMSIGFFVYFKLRVILSKFVRSQQQTVQTAKRYAPVTQTFAPPADVKVTVGAPAADEPVPVAVPDSPALAPETPARVHTHVAGAGGGDSVTVTVTAVNSPAAPSTKPAAAAAAAGVRVSAGAAARTGIDTGAIEAGVRTLGTFLIIATVLITFSGYVLATEAQRALREGGISLEANRPTEYNLSRAPLNWSGYAALVLLSWYSYEPPTRATALRAAAAEAGGNRVSAVAVPL